jgi:hypothetical protein
MQNVWDDRDVQLRMRPRLASWIGTFVSGVDNALPNDDDFEMADKVAAFIVMQQKEG